MWRRIKHLFGHDYQIVSLTLVGKENGMKYECWCGDMFIDEHFGPFTIID